LAERDIRLLPSPEPEALPFPPLAFPLPLLDILIMDETRVRVFKYGGGGREKELAAQRPV